MRVIGISGKAGSGKDTAYKALNEYYQSKGLTTTQLYFASPLKDALAQWFNWDRKRLDTDLKYKESNLNDDGTIDEACAYLGMTRRVAMQKFGTEAVRQGLHQDAWIIIQKLAIKNGKYSSYDFGFLTDCRFINELQFVRDMHGILIKIENPDRESTGTHASEMEWTQWTDWDHIIQNKIDPNLSMDTNYKILQSKLIDISKDF